MNKSSPQTQTNPFDSGDLRNYFRVNSNIKLRVERCSQDDFNQLRWPKSLSKSHSQQLLENLKAIEHESSPLLRAISEQNRSLEQYLRSINKRIELVAAFLNDSDESNSNSEEQRVLISEGGIEYQANSLSHNKLGDYLAMEIVLPLIHSSLSLFGTVINVREHKNKYLIGVKFLEHSELDRQQLAKHVIQQQLIDKRQENI